MNWQSEAAIVWVPEHHRPHPEEFPGQATPGVAGYYYYAIDALASVYGSLGDQKNRKPWIYLIVERQLLSPERIEELRPEWEREMRLLTGLQANA